MELYIFVRDYNDMNGTRVHAVIVKGSILFKEGSSYRTIMPDNPSYLIAEEINPELSVCLLRLDQDMFKTAFYSFAYINWMKEKAADIGDDGKPLYQDLVKSPETLIMYLMELGVSADTIFRYMFGPENKYLEYKYLVQEFGKML